MTSLLAKPVAEKILDEVKDRTRKFMVKSGRSPRLAVVLVGNDPASVIYTKKKAEAAVAAGMQHETLNLPETSTPENVRGVLAQLNQDPSVDGILVQRPLPKLFREEEAVYWVSPGKDVDAFHPENAGRLYLGLPCLQPCTPSGVMALLEHYQLNPAGKLACVIGRSSIVGKPMASLLLQANATVLQCHSKTPELEKLTRQADLLIVAMGKRESINERYVKKGAIVVDVGIHRNSDGKIVGDVVYPNVLPLVSAITPVPGGVGPMTIAILMRNTILAAEQAEELRP